MVTPCLTIEYACFTSAFWKCVAPPIEPLETDQQALTSQLLAFGLVHDFAPRPARLWSDL
jgi:hypothetical protein